MRWLVAAAITLSVAVGIACSAAVEAAEPAGRNGGGAGGAGGGGRTRTCLDIRRCVAEQRRQDDDCLTACKADGSPAAVAAFDAVEACTTTVGQCVRTARRHRIHQLRVHRPVRAGSPLPWPVDACLDNVIVDQVCELCF